MSAVRPPISQRQNDPDMQDLLRASFAANTRVQRIEAVRVAVSLVIAAAALLATFVSATATPIAVIGAAWAIVYVTGVNAWAKGEAKRAALVQEMFDVELFGLPWNQAAAGSLLPPHEVSWLVWGFTPARGRGDRLRDWYVDTTDVPQPYDVFICQQQNLGWDVRLRRRWAWALLFAVVIWLVLGAVIGYTAGLTFQEAVLRWYLPSTAAVLLGLDSWHAHRDIASERQGVMPIVQGAIDNAQPPPVEYKERERLLTTARAVQDVILATRRQVVRVPEWFYARFRDADERDFQANARHLRTLITRS